MSSAGRKPSQAGRSRTCTRDLYNHPRHNSNKLTMYVRIIFLTYYIVTQFASGASVYDQSQTGNLNVQIDLKDLQVIALTKSGKEEYVDYDYAYDYSEMTIKPQNGTTPKPLNVTTADYLKDNTTVVATTVSAETTTELIKSSTAKAPDAVTVTDNGNITSTTMRSVKYKNAKYTTKKSDAIVTAAPASTSNTNCTRGFVLCDGQNQNKPLSILELLSQRFKRRDHRKHSEEKQ